MAGNFPKGYAIYMTDSMARSFLSSALPSIYDDPSDDRVLKPLLINSFEGTKIGTQHTQFQRDACFPMKRAHGRPRKRLVKEVEPFKEEVLIESVAASLSSCNQLKKLEKPVCRFPTVCCSTICCSSGTRRGLEHYTACLNKSICQQALQIRSGSRRVEDNLAKRADSLQSRCSATSGEITICAGGVTELW